MIHDIRMYGGNVRKKGERVYLMMVNDQTKEEKQRWGTVESDEIPGWDYTDVRFDDFPGLVQPILSYYLFDDQ
jgi:hypothetical protein